MTVNLIEHTAIGELSNHFQFEEIMGKAQFDFAGVIQTVQMISFESEMPI